MNSIKWKMAMLYALLVVAVMIFSGVLIMLTFRNAEYRKVFQECEYTAERIVDALFVQDLETEEEVAEAFGDTVTSLLIETVNSEAAEGTEKTVYLLSGMGQLLYSRRENVLPQELSSRAVIDARSGHIQDELYIHASFDGTGQIADYAYLFQIPSGGESYVILIRQSMEMVRRSLTRITYIILLITLVGILVAGVMGYFLATTISRPILRLTRKSQELASGHLEKAASEETDPAELYESDELGQLEVHFDEMAHELSSSILELQEMEKMQKEFVANVSHELRTPITTIKSYVETILDSDMEDPEMTRHFLSVVDQESDRMTALVADLLELSKLDSHQARLILKPVDLSELLYRDLSDMSFSAGRKKQTIAWAEDMKVLETDVGERLPRPSDSFVIMGEPRRLDQVFRNLLTNAIKYSPENSLITAGVYRVEDKGEIRVMIKDQGIGISKEDQENIFLRFYRVDKARSRSMGGTGLGLAIAKEITELHNGKIWVESEPGEGSVFWTAFPEVKDEA
ncbi:MAG: HAMP domain-containing protein [Firmicutes bacterium]|nr:HAMP domain-containing protein [Bacillota bacterium]